eukprot:363925-Chlamydomonas_euryale.AAC.27
MGDAEPPRPRVRTDVRDFGAVGDGVADDSEALEAAAKATPRNGVLYLPAGTYRLTRVLKLYNRQIIIRGAGVDATTLYYPFSQKVCSRPWFQVTALPWRKPRRGLPRF